MSQSQFLLFGSRRFAPLFVTQFLGAMNDNLFKNALVILILYRIADDVGMNGPILVTVAAGVFIIPFFLFSATAGQVADKLEKSRLIRLVKLAEIAVMGLAGLAFYLGNAYVMLGVLFLMGSQSALFGPVKYGILPDHLDKHELIGGNALIEAGTFLAILIGTIAGGLIILTEHGVAIVTVLTIAIALLGWISSLSIPRAEPLSPDLAINPNFVAETWSIMQMAASRRDIKLSIMGISWFWLAGATYLSQFPNLAKNVLGADEHVVTLFLVAFSVGIGLGSLLCNRLLKGEISAKYVPFGALGMTFFTLDLYFASRGMTASGGSLLSLGEFIAEPSNWRIIGDLVATSVSAGVFAVPLYTILQSRGDPARRSRTIAANNILNALFMVIGAATAAAMLAAGWSVPEIFLAVAIANGAVAVYVCGLLPDATISG
ncbi:MAG: MFS transporter [Alphaproteobacteria bacterium]